MNDLPCRQVEAEVAPLAGLVAVAVDGRLEQGAEQQSADTAVGDDRRVAVGAVDCSVHSVDDPPLGAAGWLPTAHAVCGRAKNSSATASNSAGGR